MLFSTSLVFAGHFGFNTNILETNVLNLAVVLAIVITYVGDALRGLLANRKQTILNNFREADQRASEAQDRLNQARLQLEKAKTKADEISQQALFTVDQEKKQIILAITANLPIEDGVFIAIDKAHKYYNETFGGNNEQE